MSSAQPYKHVSQFFPLSARKYIYLAYNYYREIIRDKCSTTYLFIEKYVVRNTIVCTYLGWVGNLCGHNSALAVFRCVQESVRLQKTVSSVRHLFATARLITTIALSLLYSTTTIIWPYWLHQKLHKFSCITWYYTVN